jgi:hypothetical protein
MLAMTLSGHLTFDVAGALDRDVIYIPSHAGDDTTGVLDRGTM